MTGGTGMRKLVVTDLGVSSVNAMNMSHSGGGGCSGGGNGSVETMVVSPVELLSHKPKQLSGR